MLVGEIIVGLGGEPRKTWISAGNGVERKVYKIVFVGIRFKKEVQGDDESLN